MPRPFYMTLKSIINVFCLNRKIFLERYNTAERYRGTCNGLCEFTTKECIEELHRVIARDPHEGRLPRFYYMRAVWNNLKIKKHNEIKERRILSPATQELVNQIIKSWGSDFK